MSEVIYSILIAGFEALLGPVVYKWLKKRIKRQWVVIVLIVLFALLGAIILGTAVSVLAWNFSKDNKQSEIKPEQTMTVADSISEALDYQISHYPSSQYRDVYKNFMQDFFGPGHILADTTASARYLRHELAEEGPFEGPLYEKTGFRGNFYRVNLSVIKDSIVPFELFFDTFVKSVQGITPPSGEDWMKTWSLIDSVITVKGIHFVDEESDRQALQSQFAEGNYIAHHSRRFNDSVHFHYRIISRKNFETIILPLIKERQ